MAANRGSVVTQVRYAPGKSYLTQLRCGLCDYTLTYEKKGPQPIPTVNCPNCLKRGLSVKLFPSLK